MFSLHRKWDEMNTTELIQRWQADAEKLFSGWDFSYIQDRYEEENPTWDFVSIARSLAEKTRWVLDMGTGGGEMLSALAPQLPKNTFATEGYPPNIPIAQAKLARHGISVIPYDSDTDAHMPFRDASFDLILNRHEAFDASEVFRILKPRGYFLTQQVDGYDLADLKAHFDKTPEYPHIVLEPIRNGLENAGFQIERAETWQGAARFHDVGALVYFLHAVPWDAPEDFTVERYQKQLLELEALPKPLSFTCKRFVIVAYKPE